MELSRRRERELTRLSDEAGSLWRKQREVLSRASELLRDAGRQATEIGRDEVYPQARQSVEHALKPAFGRISRRQPEPQKLGAGAYLLMAIGAATIAVVGYAIWSTLRADDDLWVETDDDA